MKRKLKTTSTSHPYSTRSKRTKIASEILELPTDVMILIFKLLTPSERRNAINVCQQWLDLVNEYFSKDHCLVLSSALDYSTTASLYQTFSNRLTTTKDKRTFSHMEIETFPSNIEKLSLMRNFIKLVGDEVTSLRIEDIPFYPGADPVGDLFNVNVLSKLPNLESLEVTSDSVLANMSSATNLKRIKILSTVDKFIHLHNCRKIKGLETLTVPAIEISGKVLSDESLVTLLEPSTKTLIEQMISGVTYESIVLETPTFNFRGQAKLGPDDVSGININNGGKPVLPVILREFKNVKRLQFWHYSFDRQPMLMANRVTYAGITELQLVGILVFDSPPHLDKLLQSFPDVEKLKIVGLRLKNEHFSLICEFMPKLKELIVNDCRMGISVKTVFNGRYSLKDLHFLEKLEIKALYERNSSQWPPLPNLKELSLKGDGFRNFDLDFYSQIAQKCPKLTRISIDYNRGRQTGYAKFIPLLSQLKLTQLSLPNVRDPLNMEEESAFLIANLIDYGQELKELTINDSIGFSLSEEIELFTNIRSLMEVQSVTSTEDDYYDRVMKRKDVKNLKGYLVENLSLYKNLRETVDYVAENLIPPNELWIMNHLFDMSFANDYEAEEIKNFYLVTHDFLELTPFSMCRLLNRLAGTTSDII